MKLKIIISILLMTAFSAFAESGDYQHYNCENNLKASIKCNECKKIKGWTYTFKVQPINNTVLRTAYKNNETVNDVAFDNCKVVDSENWQCGEDVYSSQIMSNGFYRAFTKSPYNANFLISVCGKKKTFFE